MTNGDNSREAWILLDRFDELMVARMPDWTRNKLLSTDVRRTVRNIWADSRIGPCPCRSARPSQRLR